MKVILKIHLLKPRRHQIDESSESDPENEHTDKVQKELDNNNLYTTEVNRQVERDRKDKEIEVLLLKNTDDDKEEEYVCKRFNESPKILLKELEKSI